VVIGGVVIQYSYLETAGRSFDLAKHAETAAEEAAAPQAAVSVDEDRSASAPWSDQAEKPAPSRDMPRARTEEGMARRVTPETPPQAAAPAKPLRRAAAEVKDARRARSRLRRDEDVPAYAADKILGEGATDRPTEEPPALTDDIEYAQLDLLQEGQPSRDRAPSPSRRRREREDLGAAAPDEETAGESTREAEGDTAFKAGRAAPIVAAEKEREVRRTVGDRVFELEDGVWRQAGYAEEEAVILTRTAGELGELAEEFPDLREILEWQEGVVFEVGDKWYRLEPRP